MEKLVSEHSPSQGLSRRTLVKSAAWSVPVLASAVAAPISAASTACTKTISTTTATYSRASATASQFTWANLFGDGKDFTLSLAAAPHGAANMTINQPNNLTLYTQQQGGDSLPSVRLSLDTVTLANANGGEQVTFSFALDVDPYTVTDLSYKIKDIDGVMAKDGLGGAERVSLSVGSGTYNAAWVQGSGTGASPWRLSTSAPSAEVTPDSTAGNVAVTAALLSSFTLTYDANNSGRVDPANQNIWIGPLTFTVSGTCVP
ncbi:hypothetical protein [Microbacterium sp.]|uniref:hypothetical protein n=1 Tax=Microbacterium sp. TaxID=51671 RepID=UPI001AD1005B|nr:hypothetical protein [Microbacterium sp.]MBN9157905.1 hypothetical protein [Microbacterium sp.]